MQFINIPENRYSSIKLTFKRASEKSDYIRILNFCKDSPKTIQQIYPNAGYSAIAQEVVALAKQGYLAKYSTPEHIKTHNTMYAGIYNSYSKVWYGTTLKGRKLLNKVCGMA